MTASQKPTRCALPGCDRVIAQPSAGGAPRKYCGPDHRAEARRLRQQNRAGHDTPPTAPPEHALAATVDTGEDGVRKALPAADPAAKNADATRDARRAPGADAGGPRGSRRERPARRVRRVRRGLAASAVLVSFALAANGGSQPDHSTAASGHDSALATRSPRRPPAAPASDPLLAESVAWSNQAAGALTSIRHQITALNRARKTARAVPENRRTPELKALLHQVSARIVALRRQQAALQTSLAVRDLYQRSAAQLHAVQNTLTGIQRTPPAASGVRPSAPPLAKTLLQQQRTLTQQVNLWASNLRQTITQPLPVPLPSTDELAGRAVTAARTPLPTPSHPAQRPPVLPVAPARKSQPVVPRAVPATPTGPLEPSKNGSRVPLRHPLATSGPGGAPTAPVTVGPPHAQPLAAPVRREPAAGSRSSGTPGSPADDTSVDAKPGHPTVALASPDTPTAHDGTAPPDTTAPSKTMARYDPSAPKDRVVMAAETGDAGPAGSDGTTAPDDDDADRPAAHGATARSRASARAEGTTPRTPDGVQPPAARRDDPTGRPRKADVRASHPDTTPAADEAPGPVSAPAHDRSRRDAPARHDPADTSRPDRTPGQSSDQSSDHASDQASDHASDRASDYAADHDGEDGSPSADSDRSGGHGDDDTDDRQPFHTGGDE